MSYSFQSLSIWFMKTVNLYALPVSSFQTAAAYDTKKLTRSFSVSKRIPCVSVKTVTGAVTVTICCSNRMEFWETSSTIVECVTSCFSGRVWVTDVFVIGEVLCCQLSDCGGNSVCKKTIEVTVLTKMFLRVRTHPIGLLRFHRSS